MVIENKIVQSSDAASEHKKKEIREEKSEFHEVGHHRTYGLTNAIRPDNDLQCAIPTTSLIPTKCVTTSNAKHHTLVERELLFCFAGDCIPDNCGFVNTSTQYIIALFVPLEGKYGAFVLTENVLKAT